MKVGIIFGGFSREREISFAGGRTVYDNLNKLLFEAVPLFVDSFGNFCLLNWQNIYKGSIRDFYPDVNLIPHSKNSFQIYAENIGKLSPSSQIKLLNTIGKPLHLKDIKNHIDFAFLALHGPWGEDGKIQKLLEKEGIPYSGCGILPSSICINKVLQKDYIKKAKFFCPKYASVNRKNWLNCKNKHQIFKKILKNVPLPLIVKSANQGSSIGVHVVKNNNLKDFVDAVNSSFFIYELTKLQWENLKTDGKIKLINNLADIREGIGLPVSIQYKKGKNKIIHHPEDLLTYANIHFQKSDKTLLIESLDLEEDIIIEEFIEGQEFSCIVIQEENGNPIALPPTGINKSGNLYDYRKKYLPGLARKVTPINLPENQINLICSEAERLFKVLHCNVYARIDGFINRDGTLYFNDPNTTSGMLPSSFFFHQAAEIGLNPSQFITYIIRTSLSERIKEKKYSSKYNKMLVQLDKNITEIKKHTSDKIKVAVLMGGYSSERHISVESGRNVYEKLSSSGKYEPIPVFLHGNESINHFYHIPVSIMLKDNADDISDKIKKYKIHPSVHTIIKKCERLTNKYATLDTLIAPKQINYLGLTKQVNTVFNALHGGSGENGFIQKGLQKYNIPYNGSDSKTSKVTINKFITNEILKNNEFNVPQHLIINKHQWNTTRSSIIQTLRKSFPFPFIVKPLDDGCSTAVKKIHNVDELINYASLIFRDVHNLPHKPAAKLHLNNNEEFPQKKEFLVEKLITKNNSTRFLEITVGLLTHYDDKGNRVYEIFEPSEALAEADILSLEEKFLAGQGQNITPARFSDNKSENKYISDKIKNIFESAAKILNIEGYARIDAFVRIYENNKAEVIFIEANSLPGMTPATCIFHQCAINGYKPYDFIDKIIEYGLKRLENTPKHS